MARLSPDAEQQLSDSRARKRQSKNPPLLIRDDGLLYPNVPLVAKKQNFRPYHGDPKASLQDRMRYLQGLGAKRAVTYTPADDEPFDIGQADTDALINFAMEQYGAALDPTRPIKVLREEVFKLSQIPDAGVASGSALGGDHPDPLLPAGDYALQKACEAAATETTAVRPRGKPGPKPKGIALS